MTDVHLVNLRAFLHLPEGEIQQHLGEYALFVEGRVTAYFPSNREALRVALQAHEIGEFSVLRVEPQPVDLGFLDCADYSREAR